MLFFVYNLSGLGVRVVWELSTDAARHVLRGWVGWGPRPAPARLRMPTGCGVLLLWTHLLLSRLAPLGSIVCYILNRVSSSCLGDEGGSDAPYVHVGQPNVAGIRGLCSADSAISKAISFNHVFTPTDHHAG